MRSTARTSCAAPELPTTPQIPHMLARQGYVVVSCHVERPLDGRVWPRYAALLRSRPGGLRIASLMRPPAEGEDRALWLARAREAAALGPLGQHTHWTSPSHARPSGDSDTGARVLEEGRRLAADGLDARFFCGGGWYFDASVAAAVAELGYHDCTGTSFRPAYLPAGAARLAVDQPARLRLPDGRLLLELPATHSLGAALRALGRRGGPRVLHLYFHDTDLLDLRRRAAVRLLLALLPRLRRPIDLDALAGLAQDAPELPLEERLGAA